MAAIPTNRVFSGVQPSGLPHLGNYLGAFRNYIALQEDGDAIYCIVDYHALTSTHDSERIRGNTRDMAITLLALGLDPERAILFRQSDRPEHAELAYLLSTVVPVSWVERTPTFKEKVRDQPDDVNHALLTYPVLQTADIAIYHAATRPGRQGPGCAPRARARDRARLQPALRRVLHRAGGGVHRITRDPGHGRRPEDVQSVGNVIEILADEDVVRKQVMSMVTDTQRIKRTEPGRPEVCNVCQLHRFFGTDYETIWDGERTARTGCVDTKKLLAERILDHFAEARERRRELEARPEYVEEVLRAGADKLAPMAAETLRAVHELMGLSPKA